MFEELKNIKSTESELKKFGKTMGIVSFLFCALLLYYHRDSYIYFLTAGLFLLLAAYIYPLILKPFQIFWMGLAVVLGWFSTRVILSILFYFIITPLKYIAMLFGKRFLDLQFRKPTATYWNYRTPGEMKPEDYEKQF